MNINSVSLPIDRLAVAQIVANRHRKFLPARLNNARDLALQRQLTKTDATQVELSQVTSGSTAAFAASVGAHSKFRPA
jgi:membrane-bound inhibitor of C-type lysozyme